MKAIGQSRKGMGDGPNEDAIGWDEQRSLALLADGMGGYASGEIASRIVKDTLLQGDSGTDLTALVLSAHAKISQAAAGNPAFTGMGSTVVAFTIAERVARVVWVGDSRAYLWRRGRLRRLTRDHSVAEHLRETEHLSEAEVASHPLRRTLLQALGKELSVPSVLELALHQGDWLILCSDGLTGVVDDENISRVLRRTGSMTAAAEALISTAFTHGSEDDISVVIAEHTGAGGKLGLDWHPGPRTAIWLSILAGVLGAVVLTGIVKWLTRSSH
jgi:protein phosphatase